MKTNTEFPPDDVKYLTLKSKLPFGKYKGFIVGNVVLVNASYLNWFDKEVQTYQFDAEALITIADYYRKEKAVKKRRRLNNYYSSADEFADSIIKWD